MAIFIHSEDIQFSLIDERSTINWVENILTSYEYVAENINYIFCSDEHLLEVNKKYLNHDTLTDIITFDNTENEKEIEADIFISIDRVKDNAAGLNKEFDDELHRVIIHGLLHILGYSDKTVEEKKRKKCVKKRMTVYLCGEIQKCFT